MIVEQIQPQETLVEEQGRLTGGQIIEAQANTNTGMLSFDGHLLTEGTNQELDLSLKTENANSTTIQVQSVAAPVAQLPASVVGSMTSVPVSLQAGTIQRAPVVSEHELDLSIKQSQTITVPVVDTAGLPAKKRKYNIETTR